MALGLTCIRETRAYVQYLSATAQTRPTHFVCIVDADIIGTVHICHCFVPQNAPIHLIAFSRYIIYPSVRT